MEVRGIRQPRLFYTSMITDYPTEYGNMSHLICINCIIYVYFISHLSGRVCFTSHLSGRYCILDYYSILSIHHGMRREKCLHHNIHIHINLKSTTTPFLSFLFSSFSFAPSLINLIKPVVSPSIAFPSPSSPPLLSRPLPSVPRSVPALIPFACATSASHQT